MGHKFSLVLSRVITDEESTILQNAGCGDAIFSMDSLPTNAEVTVTKMDFDDTVSSSLAGAIEAALEAVKKVPDLTVPGLTVPAVVQEAVAEETVAEETVAKEAVAKEAAAEDAVLEGTVVKPRPRTRKATTRKATTKKVEAAAKAD
jgi:hypothetical protein